MDRDIIDKCIDQNILVFDGNATVGHITKKLIWNILRFCPDCDTLYVPKDVYVEFVPDDWIGFHEGIKMFGINVIFNDQMGELGQYYEQQGKTLACGDIYLLLATSRTQMYDKTNTIIASC